MTISGDQSASRPSFWIRGHSFTAVIIISIIIMTCAYGRGRRELAWSGINKGGAPRIGRRREPHPVKTVPVAGHNIDTAVSVGVDEGDAAACVNETMREARPCSASCACGVVLSVQQLGRGAREASHHSRLHPVGRAHAPPP